MAVGQRSGSVLGPIQRLFGRGTVSGLSEGQLLARFVGDRDELAFEAIVSRHGPMVLGICRRLLDDPHDVEDAFQATFLVLVRRADSLRDRDLLANWLYGVALRIATRCRRDRATRRVRERSAGETEPVTCTEEDGLGELRTVIDVEVARLPERFRLPLVLCYFEGLTHDQAAERLGCPVGTVRSRMAKAREILRARLTRRGFGAVPVIPTASPAALSPSVPPVLLIRTTAASDVASRSLSLLAGGESASASAVTLARGVLRVMTFTKWMTIVAVLAVLGAVGGGVRVAARQDGAGAATGPEQLAKSEAAGRPPRQAIEELQAWISRSETQLARSQGVLDQLRMDNAKLEKKVRELEARIKGDAGKPKDAPQPPEPPKSPKSAEPAVKPFAVDRIMTGPSSIVAISGAKDRVVIYATESGRSDVYRPPPGMTEVSVSFYEDNVTIVANGRGVAHLANYNLKTNQWALQDIRLGADGHVDLPEPGPQGSMSLLACIYRGAGFIQLAVLDFQRATWVVQNLREPSERSVEPFVAGKLVMYVAGPYVYAYSAEAGKWDTLGLEESLLPIGLSPDPAITPC